MADQVIPFHPDWLDWPEVKRMLSLLDEAGVKACFAGGCLRDALAGIRPNDFDIIVDTPMSVILPLCQSAGIEAVTIEASWGIVRATINGVVFDLLYIYERVAKMSGRDQHSFQEMIDIWLRYFDFTINAIYFFPSGELHNRFGGIEDLKAGRIRFLGGHEGMISNDRRWALRFFRFYAWFGKGEPDAESLKVCVAQAPELLKLAHELVQAEMKKLLSAPHLLPTLLLMHQHNVIKYALGFAISHCGLIETMARIETLRGITSPWQVRLTLLMLSAPIPPEAALDHLSEFWKLSDASKKELATLLEYAIAVDADMPEEARNALVAELGADMLRNLLLIRWALEDDAEAVKDHYLAAIAMIN